MLYKSFPLRGFKALGDEGAGQFEAIVAVFNNVDRAGDRIVPGAFTRTLGEWEAKGRPIPVIYAHQWDNLDAHIGKVLEAKEVEEGLYVQAQLDMGEAFAKRVWKKMREGTLAEFSFAYDVADGKMAKGVYELRDLDLLEVGPCLVGMNPETELIAVKEALLRKAGARHTSKEFEEIQQIHDLAVALGAKCAAPEGDDSGAEGGGADDEGDGEGKAREYSRKLSGPSLSTFAARAAMDLMEMGAD